MLRRKMERERKEFTLVRVQPPPPSQAVPADQPDPVLTQATYQALEVLAAVYDKKKPRQPIEAEFWQRVLDLLHEAPIAPLWMAQTIANGLGDDLAYIYDAEGWREEADGWRKAAHVIAARGYARAGLEYPLAGLTT